MNKVGICVEGKSCNGGSYQFWLSVIKALSELDRTRFHVQVFSSDAKWIQLAEDYALNYVKLNEKKSWLNRRIENTYWGYKYVPIIGKALSFLYKHFDCNMQIMKKNILDLCICQQVDEIGDLLNIPMLIPIFDLMHRYDNRFPELTTEYKWRDRMYAHQCRVAEVILADSDVGKQHIVECYGDLREDLGKHVKVLPFVPPDYIYTAESKKPEEELFEKYFFYPAQFWTHKNHKNLILAAFRLKEKGIPIKVIFVGSEQNNKEHVLELIRQKAMEKDIKILGYVSNEEMVYLYKHARALVMPTYLGPTNIPQLEAFELGCPVATSRIYGIPDQVGDAALLFDPDSVEEIENCMERLWLDDELCQSLIEKGKEKVDSWGQRQFNAEFGRILDDYFGKQAGYFKDLR